MVLTFRTTPYLLEVSTILPQMRFYYLIQMFQILTKMLCKPKKTNLKKAQQTATEERLGVTSNSVREVHTKANNWGETRPE